MSVDGGSSPPPHSRSDTDLKIIVDTYACVTAGVLFLAFFANATRFRLWHTNSFLEKLLALVDSPVTYLVIGETNIEAKIKEPEYTADLELPKDVVTIERVWSCNKQIIGEDRRLKDACVGSSFQGEVLPIFKQYHRTVLVAVLEGAPRGTKEGKAVVVSPDVKEVILRSLEKTGSYLTYGIQSLAKNDVHSHLAWTCALNSEFHTLIVWHIATGLCAIHPTSEGVVKATVQRGCIWQLFQKSKRKETGKPDHHLVASHLSRYCAYLMVFCPDMLPESPFSVKLLLQKVLEETKVFFGGATRAEDKYQKMMQYEHSGNGLVEMGVRLGKQLVQIHDDAKRWKIMADFWSEMIIFLAPHGKVREHQKRLQSGGEFITQLWALLYHAGITDQTATASNHIP